MQQDWGRPNYTPGGGDASVLYVVFGPKPEPLRVTSLAHRVLPMELSLELEYQPHEIAAGLLESPIGQTMLIGWEGDDPAKLTMDGCMVIRAEVPDPKDLLYLRNCIGVVTAVLEGGGHAVANLQSAHLYTPVQWTGVIFAPDQPQPRLQVDVFHAEETDGSVSMRTRGMRAFGRPDLNLTGVPAGSMARAAELCNHLIDLQASGAVIPDGEPITGDGLPPGLIARHAGRLEDPEFNNVHIDLAWAASPELDP